MEFISNRKRRSLHAATALLAMLTLAVPYAHSRTQRPNASSDLPIGSVDCQTEKFGLFRGPDIVDITGIDNGCPDVINAIRSAILHGQHPLTSRHLYYLSELAPFLGRNCERLPCFLKAVNGTEFGAATLVIDEPVTLSEPLVIPSRYTLAGTGIDGEGALRFTGLANGVSAIRFDSQATNITIRDIAIGRLDGGTNIGIDVSRANKVFIRDVIVTGSSLSYWCSVAGDAILERISRNSFNSVEHSEQKSR